ncbi:hypothetical protein K470DRAFT_40130 [Piedraia hortae CBS 480.64]|uniref:Uncharacterized protein n=1 Tax=Piedraia hortae CBS 480.64 TaxID=1314780 RepID=A0A6A7C1B8_9PEZI|nr:hypothetical protein K470DRAFT_40130 [Piedraia hortae CBS 480.64]
MRRQKRKKTSVEESGSEGPGEPGTDGKKRKEGMKSKRKENEAKGGENAKKAEKTGTTHGNNQHTPEPSFPESAYKDYATRRLQIGLAHVNELISISPATPRTKHFWGMWRKPNREALADGKSKSTVQERGRTFDEVYSPCWSS